MPIQRATAQILVHSLAGGRLDKIKASMAVLRGGTIKRRNIKLKADAQVFRIEMPVGEHSLFVSAPGHYEAARRVLFVPNAEPVIRVLLEPLHKAEFPSFDELPKILKGIFARSSARQNADDNVVYNGLNQLKKAAALNILAKMQSIEVPYPGSKSILQHVDHVYDFFQDRIYVGLKKNATSVDRMVKLVQEGNTRFTIAPSALHEGFQAASFKTEEQSGKGNLQLSFNADDPQHLKIDADIDIYTDVLRHLFGEVFRNHLTGLKTDPYRVYRVLTDNDIQPEYRLA